MAKFPENFMELTDMQDIADDVWTFRKFVHGIRVLEHVRTVAEANRSWIGEAVSINAPSTTRTFSEHFRQWTELVKEAGWGEAAHSALWHVLSPNETLTTALERSAGTSEILSERECVRVMKEYWKSQK